MHIFKSEFEIGFILLRLLKLTIRLYRWKSTFYKAKSRENQGYLSLYHR